MTAPVSGYVWNCYTKSREGDGPLFVAHDDTVTARLDGYAVIPMEEHNALVARIARLEAALRFYRWQEPTGASWREAGRAVAAALADAPPGEKP